MRHVSGQGRHCRSAALPVGGEIEAVPLGVADVVGLIGVRIVYPCPRFLDLLLEGGQTSPPFTQRQRNDFAIGLVHETVHWEKDNTANPANFHFKRALLRNYEPGEK